MARFFEPVNAFCVFLLTLHFTDHTISIGSDEAISNHIRKCCESGLQRGSSFQNNCDNYQYEVLTIPPLWRGLCYSTFALCCSRENVKQVCTAGRLAALTGSRCDEQNNTNAYADCCRSCQVGLAVKASSKTNCNDPLFKYFSEIESYRICCSSDLSTSTEDRFEDDSEEEDGSNKDDENYTNIEKDSYQYLNGTIILEDDDDDICGKVPNLCAHVCENTKEAYRCKCHEGFTLDPNNVTCSLANKSQDVILGNADNGLYDDDDESENTEKHETFTKEKKCAEGYQADLRLSKCIDIDECLLKTDTCKASQYCHNTIGSFRCLNVKNKICESGYRFNLETEKCEDYNECNDSPCEANYICLNFPGHYECKRKSTTSYIDPGSIHSAKPSCTDGFILKNGHCFDVDECLEDDNACDSTQVCTNDIGGYHCDCKLGFNLDATTNACVDINECSINNHNCLPTQRCDNTVGSYICTRLQSCGTGYTLNAETGICDDDDECALHIHNCTPDYECINTKGSFRCRRRPPPSTTTSTPSTTSTTTTTTTTKAPSHIIQSEHGSHQYSLYPTYVSHQTQSRNDLYENPYKKGNDQPCGTGFYRNYMDACVDVNECLVGSSCGSHQRCINTNGSYRCQNLLQCSAGYRSTPEGTQCVDIDECETGEHNCLGNQICRNRVGGFICTCPPGHQLSARMSKGLSQCVDIDECEQQHPTVCPSNAQCVNTLGSYYCECKSGYQKSRDNDRICLDVDECQEIAGLCQQKCVNFWGGYRCSCNPGYELSIDNRTCNDVDECEVHKSYKLCMGFCNNVPGSYECSCPRGYTLAMDKTTCRDIDECSSGEFCTGRNDICTNVRGSYRCTTIQCPFGYINDPDKKNRCRQSNNFCEGNDCYNKPSAYTYNFITLVSKLMIPPEGRVIFSLRGPIWYDDIDFSLKIHKIQAAAYIEKASDNHFDMIKGKHEVHVSLKRSLEGPQDVELELSMTVFTNGLPRGKSVAKIFILVSQYTF